MEKTTVRTNYEHKEIRRLFHQKQRRERLHSLLTTREERLCCRFTKEEDCTQRKMAHRRAFNNAANSSSLGLSSAALLVLLKGPGGETREHNNDGRRRRRRTATLTVSTNFTNTNTTRTTASVDDDDGGFWNTTTASASVFFPWWVVSRASCLGTPTQTKEGKEKMEDVEVHIEGEEENDFKNKGRHTAQWRVYTDLGREKFLAGDVEFALKCFERALKEAKLGFGEKDAHVAAALNNLAERARTQRMWEKAEGLYKECLDLLRELKEKTGSNSNSKIDKSKGGEYKTEATIAAALHNLASCMLQNNKPKEAYENYRTSLNLKQLVFENENHPEIALTLHHMAEALLLLDRIEDAIVVLERSVKITDAIGIGHTQTQFRRMRRLCQLYEMKKRYDDVLAMKKRIKTQFSKQV